MARLELRVLFCIVSTLAVLSQVLIDDSVIPRAWASDEELIIRYFDAGKDNYFRFMYDESLNETLQEQRQFRSEMQIQFIGNQERILSGAMDAAFVLELNLTLGAAYTGVFSWKAAEYEGCVDFLSSKNPLQRNYACHNHIRYFNFLPGDKSKFLICGSNGYLPNCVTLNVNDLNGGLFQVSDKTPLQERSKTLVPNDPTKSFCAIPRKLESADSVLVNTMTTSESNQGALGIYNVSVSVSQSQASSVDIVTTNEVAFTNPAVNNIIEGPQEFVSLFSLDYQLGSEDPGSQDYIYVAFKEELKQLQQSSSNCVTRNRQVQSWISRIGRICKLLPLHFFTLCSDVAVSETLRQPRSFVKAEIYCNIKSTSNLQLDYAFQEIAGFEVVRDSIPSSDIPESAMYGYGLFSEGGSSFGPTGSAVCIYPAERTVASGTGSQNNNNGLYDIFLRQYLGGTHNRNYNCKNSVATRMINSDYRNIEIESPLTQIGNYPLFILDGIHLTKIQVDSKRPILGTDNQIIYRDVVFVASSNGKIYKITVFDSQPVVSDIIQLRGKNEEDDNSVVYNLKLRATDTDSPYLFASTNISIYRLPTSECSRYTSCQECVRSRDPYCVWDIDMKMCTSINKSIGSPAPSRFLQDVFGTKSVLESEECTTGGNEISDEDGADNKCGADKLAAISFTDAIISVSLIAGLLTIALLGFCVVVVAALLRRKTPKRSTSERLLNDMEL